MVAAYVELPAGNFASAVFAASAKSVETERRAQLAVFLLDKDAAMPCSV